MSCGLNQEQRDISEYLVKGRCLSQGHSISLKAIERDLGVVIEDLEEVLDDLVGKSYLGCKKKKVMNYYADAGRAIKALAAHGVSIWKGGRGGL